MNSDKKRILVVDDEETLCEVLSFNLENEGYEVTTALSAEEALALDLTSFDLILLDIMLGAISGTQIAEIMKRRKDTAEIPIIFCTAKDSEDDMVKGLNLGADDYITKPFNYQLLRLRIHKFIELFERNHRMFKNQIDVEPSEITITSLDEKLVEKAIKIVEDHMEDPEFSVEVLSQELALSRGYLYKKLMAITGKGPAEFIRTIRLKRARQLLAKSQLQIAEVAYKCGFNSPKRFAQNFRNEFGMLPSEYLKGLS